jgi:hypothetical protein
MRGFLLRLGLFVGIGLLLLSGLQVVSRQWPANYTHLVEMQRVQNLLDEADQLEVLVLGNSHARTFDWTQMGVRGRDLGLPWNEAVSVLHQIRALDGDLPRVHTVLIAISPITFQWENRLAGESYLFGRRIFHAAVPRAGPVEGDWHSYVRGRAYWLVREDNWYRVMLGLLGRDPYAAERASYNEIRAESVPQEVLAHHAEDRVRHKTTQQEAMVAKNPRLSEDGYRALSTAIAGLQARGIRVVLFTPPYYWRYVELYDQHPAWTEMQRLAQRLADQHGVPWLDFSADPLSRDHTSFRDSDHLNERGQAVFSRQFVGAVCGTEAATVEVRSAACFIEAPEPVVVESGRDPRSEAG